MKILVFESDYTGEINGRLGVAEWLEGKVTHVPLSVATAVVEGVGNAEEFNDHDILIAGTGEDTTELGLKFANKVGRPLTVFLASILPDELDPSIQQYDLIVAPPHSQLSGERVLTMLGVPHRFRPGTPTFDTIPGQPKLALLLGGNTRYCEGFTVDYAQRLGDRLLRQANLWNGKFIITNSRRTPEAALQTLRQVLAPVESRFLEWDAEDSHDYKILLQEADIVFCTGDSLSMCSEAAMTGKPLLVSCDEEAMESYHTETIRRMVEKGHAIIFREPVEDLPDPVLVLDTTEKIGQKITELLIARKQTQS